MYPITSAQKQQNGNRLIALCAVAAAVLAVSITGCDKVLEFFGGEKKEGLVRESDAPTIGQYDKVALKRRFGEPHETTEKLGWIKKEHGVRYNNRWMYHYRKNKDSVKLTTRALYFIDDEFQGAVIIDEEGRARREKIGSL